MARIRTLPNTIEKKCPTCNQTFVISYYLRNKRTYCGRVCANADPNIKHKIVNSQIKTFKAKYGMHPMRTIQTKENLKTSVMKKYGVNWISKSDGWYDKIKANNIIKYGVEIFTNREKSKKTCMEKYGVENPMQSKSIQDSMMETKREIHYNSLVDFCFKNNLKLMTERENYIGYNWKHKYKFCCLKCNYIFDSNVYNLNSLFCERCDPDKKKTLENDFFNFLTSLNPTPLITRHDRTILYGKELDFYLPEKKIAIELDGLYWHSENGGGILKHYHLNKFKGSMAHGIRLIHIFENEWRDNPELIKSIIKTILNVNENKTIYARKCNIKEVAPALKNIFLNENHLRGEDKTNIKLGLYDNDNLVSLMTFSKSRFDKKIEWEMSRFCNIKNHIVIGGASKLFKYFIKNYSPNSVVSYCDRRIFSGNIYHQLGFRFYANTAPSYHYITPDYKSLLNRMHFQKHKLSKKLSIFDSSLSEWENMKNNGYDRIWDCGCSKWVWTSHLWSKETAIPLG